MKRSQARHSTSSPDIAYAPTRIAGVLCIVLFSSPKVFGQDFSGVDTRFFEAVRQDNLRGATAAVREIANISRETLRLHLSSESIAKAFWVNLYNSFVQYRLKTNPERFKDRDAFFTSRDILVAGHKLSFDDIEHGILRRSTYKYSFGYFQDFFSDDFEKEFRLSRVDYRIHFALNCGARSCPPIVLFTADRVEEQLESATRSYLTTTVNYDANEDVVWVPALCSWYRGDFGGEAGVINILKKFNLLPVDKEPALRYLPYDWNLYLSNYHLNN